MGTKADKYQLEQEFLVIPGYSSNFSTLFILLIVNIRCKYRVTQVTSIVGDVP